MEVKWLPSHPGRCTLWKETRYPVYRRLGGPQSRSGLLRRGKEYPAVTRIRTQDRLAHSQVAIRTALLRLLFFVCTFGNFLRPEDGWAVRPKPAVFTHNRKRCCIHSCRVVNVFTNVSTKYDKTSFTHFSNAWRSLHRFSWNNCITNLTITG